MAFCALSYLLWKKPSEALPVDISYMQKARLGAGGVGLLAFVGMVLWYCLKGTTQAAVTVASETVDKD
jgi:hypothetical protein